MQQMQIQIEHQVFGLSFIQIMIRKKLDTVVDNYYVVNLIQNNGENIIEVVDDSIGKSNNANRITFVKTENGYEFFGVYKIIQNGTTRVYKRISDIYPMN